MSSRRARDRSWPCAPDRRPGPRAGWRRDRRRRPRSWSGHAHRPRAGPATRLPGPTTAPHHPVCASSVAGCDGTDLELLGRDEPFLEIADHRHVPERIGRRDGPPEGQRQADGGHVHARGHGRAAWCPGSAGSPPAAGPRPVASRTSLDIAHPGQTDGRGDGRAPACRAPGHAASGPATATPESILSRTRGTTASTSAVRGRQHVQGVLLARAGAPGPGTSRSRGRPSRPAARAHQVDVPRAAAGAWLGDDRQRPVGQVECRVQQRRPGHGHRRPGTPGTAATCRDTSRAPAPGPGRARMPEDRNAVRPGQAAAAPDPRSGRRRRWPRPAPFQERPDEPGVIAPRQQQPAIRGHQVQARRIGIHVRGPQVHPAGAARATS